MKNDRKMTASDNLQQQLEKSLLNRQFIPGDRLPSERQIMSQFKVGRGTVRAAYRSLQQKGLIEIKHGGGAFVQEIDSSKVGDTLATLILHRGISTEHLQEFREAVETRCAGYAAERATQEQINNLKIQIDQMEGMLGNMSNDYSRFYELELSLHTEVAKISDNPLFEWFASTFEQNAAAFSKALINQSEKPEEALKDWHKFIQAIENKEVTKASMIMGSHIFHFRKAFENLEQDKND